MNLLTLLYYNFATVWRGAVVLLLTVVILRVGIGWLFKRKPKGAKRSLLDDAKSEALKKLKCWGFNESGNLFLVVCFKLFFWLLVVVNVLVSVLKVVVLTLLGFKSKKYLYSQYFLGKICFVLSVVIVACVAWSFYEPYTTSITFNKISTSKITKSLRIVQLSDLHSDPTPRLEKNLPDIIRNLKPDLILLTGDYINQPEGLAICRELFTSLAKIAPSYGVKGNWEGWWFQNLDMFKGTGVKEIDRESFPVNIKGQEIWLSGGGVESDNLLAPHLRKMPSDKFRIFLHHFPQAWKVANGFADLHLAGDTHDGQARLPLLGPLARMVRSDRRFYSHGLQKQGDILLYVNRGIGMEGGIVPRARFNCPPEIAVIDLLPASWVSLTTF